MYFEEENTGKKKTRKKLQDSLYQSVKGEVFKTERSVHDKRKKKNKLRKLARQVFLFRFQAWKKFKKRERERLDLPGLPANHKR